MTANISDLDYLASAYAAAAGAENPQLALDQFAAITNTDESACDAWIGRISRGDYDRTTLFRAWYSRRNFGVLADAADLSVVSLQAWVPIGGEFANLSAPVISPAVLSAGYALSEAINAKAYDDALEVLADNQPSDLIAWVRAVIYATGTRWDKVIEALNEHAWREPIYAQCAEVLHGAAATHLGLFAEAERRLINALQAEHSKIPCAQHGAWYLAMVYRATGREEEAMAKLEWLHANFPSPKVEAARKDPTVRLPVTTRERIAERSNPWQDEAQEGGGPIIRKELLADATAQLQRQIGLEGVKEQIADYRASVQMAAVRAAKGLKAKQGSRHMIFSGPPGTGKTTIAHIVALNLAGLGVIPEPKVVVANGRADLCAEYEGQSATKTSRLVDRALDGVLFIDEFYTVVQDRDGRADPFGKEAVDTLLARMENERHRLVVIIAGYPTDIDRALETNDGLPSRFSVRIEFDSYTPEEIVQIAEVIAVDNDSILTKEARDELLTAAGHLAGEQINGKPGLDLAGNGRYARAIVEAGERARDRRQAEVLDPEELTIEELQVITGEDMKAAVRSVHTRLMGSASR
ncbi:type VII secretion AAA-ATPase EccA [Mycolicibacterium peregrinum]|uniref:type VII secretion AAA-ATPase EccA n=1 Tax=Mycolicibacterium peregrinum TaxID=43304 RepID=UPI000B4BF448|nr:type VII secretion AAA-ATPase EccA [Mycolicibacterium peregrinum]OWM07856.1 type VII secretion AAA-ATPase EccA [Mycolicibacterium peregrinum]